MATQTFPATRWARLFAGLFALGLGIGIAAVGFLFAAADAGRDEQVEAL